VQDRKHHSQECYDSLFRSQSRPDGIFGKDTGIEALTRTLALEGRDLGIRVNAIAPGLVDTASNIAAMKPKDLKRWTKREDIAETVLFLASPAASGITGQVIAVTGWGL